jgi:DNA-binding beta-propeller fold protein YncE
MKIQTVTKALLGLFSLLLSIAVSAQPMTEGRELYLVTNAAGTTLSYVDLQRGVIDRVEVGTAPFDLALDQQGRAYVTTAEGVAVVDIQQRRRTALIPYQADVGRAGFGEYRKGGMGIRVSADGSRVYVGVYLGSRPSHLEIMDTAKERVIGSVALGIRPFQLILSPDRQQLYSIDHDSYSVTVVDLATLKSRTLALAPLGYAAFDKPHYAATGADGSLILPLQGKVLALLDPASGKLQTMPLSADTHQHGITLSRDKNTAFIVGTGPAGRASSGPSLSVVNLQNGKERLIPLEREHEQVVLNSDESRAILTGGNSFTQGWNGITVVDLKSGNLHHLEVPDQPLGIRQIPRSR